MCPLSAPASLSLPQQYQCLEDISSLPSRWECSRLCFFKRKKKEKEQRTKAGARREGQRTSYKDKLCQQLLTNKGTNTRATTQDETKNVVWVNMEQRDIITTTTTCSRSLSRRI